jgi:hypothetical protein
VSPRLAAAHAPSNQNCDPCRDLAAALAGGSEVYRVIDTTLIPAKVRVRTCRKGLFAAQAAFDRCVSKTEWVYGFKVGLAVSPRVS